MKCLRKSSLRPSVMAETDSPEVLDVMTLPGLRCSSTMVNTFCLTSILSSTTSTIQSHSESFCASSV